ncbi:MAG: divalent-cation tolerance protein CutA [Pseudomonadota bacterium]
MSEALALRVACPNAEAAREIARSAVDKRLAASANVILPVESHYRWEGRVHSAPETLLWMTTHRACLSGLTALIHDLHPYELPAITWHPVEADTATAAWINESADRTQV